MRARRWLVLGLVWTTASVATEPRAFSPEDAKGAVQQHVDSATRDGGGVYRIRDDFTGETLELTFEQIAIVGSDSMWKVHYPTRSMNGGGYFACTTFRPAHRAEDKRYDLDFLITPRDGTLAVTDVVVHREARKVAGQWVWSARLPKPSAPGVSAK